MSLPAALRLSSVPGTNENPMGPSAVSMAVALGAACRKEEQ